MCGGTSLKLSACTQPAQAIQNSGPTLGVAKKKPSHLQLAPSGLNCLTTSILACGAGWQVMLKLVSEQAEKNFPFVTRELQLPSLPG